MNTGEVLVDDKVEARIDRAVTQVDEGGRLQMAGLLQGDDGRRRHETD